MNETTSACRWVGGQRLTPRHDRHCEQAGCAGCEPCQMDHCKCGRHLRASEPLTCAECVGRTRNDLSRIDELCRLAPVAAAEVGAGVDSAVMVLAGPVPERSTYAARHAYALGGALCRCVDCPDQTPMPEGPRCEKASDKNKPCLHYVCRRQTWRPTCPGLADWLEYADDERHPLWVLGTWDMLVTEHLGHDRRARVTVASAAAYLDQNLTYLGQDRDFAFDEFARELRSCREHVETVMGVAEWVLKGAPCPTCRRPLECRRGKVESSDRWKCPTKDCDVDWTQSDYDTHVYRAWLSTATRLTAAQMLAQYRVPEMTLRSWAAPTRVRRDGELIEEEPRLRCVGRDADGRKLYPVDVVLRLRDSA